MKFLLFLFTLGLLSGISAKSQWGQSLKLDYKSKFIASCVLVVYNPLQSKIVFQKLFPASWISKDKRRPFSWDHEKILQCRLLDEAIGGEKVNRNWFQIKSSWIERSHAYFYVAKQDEVRWYQKSDGLNLHVDNISVTESL